MRESKSGMKKSSTLNELSKPQVIDLLHRVRSKSKNLKQNAQRLTNRVLGAAIAAGTGYGLGYWMGGMRHEKETILKTAGLDPNTTTPEQADAALEAAGGDPTQWFGVNKDIVVAVGLTGVALTGLAGDADRSTVGMVVEHAAAGSLGAAFYGAGLDKGYDSSISEAA